MCKSKTPALGARVFARYLTTQYNKILKNSLLLSFVLLRSTFYDPFIIVDRFSTL
jgi:hypothetical protein